jgi:gamma-glutamyltranspeptidase/glutathione hydrolase
MVVAAHPLAADTALRILQSGGNAVDAAIAAQIVLTLVEPQSSGIGGGGFLLYYDGKSRDLDFYDGRETAPARATANMFLSPVARQGFL